MAVFMRPLDQLLLNVGALVLGVWGIRAILLGTSLTGVTAVDLSLTMVILFLLAAITLRTMLYLYHRAGLSTPMPRFLRRRLPPAQPPATDIDPRMIAP